MCHRRMHHRICDLQLNVGTNRAKMVGRFSRLAENLRKYIELAVGSSREEFVGRSGLRVVETCGVKDSDTFQPISGLIHRIMQHSSNCSLHFSVG